MRIRVEPAQPDDLAYFWWLYQASYRAVILDQFGGWDEKEQRLAFVRKWQAGGYQRIVADDRIGGALWTRALPEYHELVELQLAPALRNRGLGTAMLRREMERAAAQAKPLRLSVLFKNPALRLYQRLGFQIVGRSAYQYHLAVHPCAETGQARGDAHCLIADGAPAVGSNAKPDVRSDLT